MEGYTVECQECNTKFFVVENAIHTTLGDEISIEDPDGFFDYGFIHNYSTHCYTCGKTVWVDILDPHPCCINLR